MVDMGALNFSNDFFCFLWVLEIFWCVYGLFAFFFITDEKTVISKITKIKNSSVTVRKKKTNHKTYLARLCS